MTRDPLAGRPFRREDIFGQEQAIADVEAYILARRVSCEPAAAGARILPMLRALLLCGPPGLGKTTLARNAACSFQCSAATEPRPCGHCRACRGFQCSPPRAMHDYIEINAAEHSGIAAMSDLAGWMRVAAFGYRVAFIDEAHALTPAGTDALLKVTEEPAPHAIVILATTREARIAETLRSRCRIVRLRAARPSDRLRFLLSRCEALGIDSAARDETALTRVMHQAGPSYRALSDEFERVLAAIGERALTVAAVREVSPPQDFDFCLACLDLLIDGNVPAAVACRRDWPVDPAAQAAAMQAFLLELSLVEVRGGSLGSSALAILLPEDRQTLVARLAAWHARSGAGASLSTFVEDCARFLGGA